MLPCAAPDLAQARPSPGQDGRAEGPLQVTSPSVVQASKDQTRPACFFGLSRSKREAHTIRLLPQAVSSFNPSIAGIEDGPTAQTLTGPAGGGGSLTHCGSGGGGGGANSSGGGVANTCGGGGGGGPIRRLIRRRDRMSVTWPAGHVTCPFIPSLTRFVVSHMVLCFHSFSLSRRVSSAPAAARLAGAWAAAASRTARWCTMAAPKASPSTLTTVLRPPLGHWSNRWSDCVTGDGVERIDRIGVGETTSAPTAAQWRERERAQRGDVVVATPQLIRRLRAADGRRSSRAV